MNPSMVSPVILTLLVTSIKRPASPQWVAELTSGDDAMPVAGVKGTSAAVRAAVNVFPDTLVTTCSPEIGAVVS